MKTIKVNLYSFEELSEESKEIAIENYNNSYHEFFAGEDGINSIKAGIKYFDFDLNNWEFDYSDHNRSYVDISSDNSELEYVRLWKYLINQNYINDDFLSGNCPFTGYCVDESFLDPIRNFINKPYDVTFEELIIECVESALIDIQNDYEYTLTEVYIAEEFEQMETEFTIDGNIY